MIQLSEYKKRLEQLENGNKEIYEGEKELVMEVIRNMESLTQSNRGN